VKITKLLSLCIIAALLTGCGQDKGAKLKIGLSLDTLK
jgi:hypothetical protein